MAQSAARRVDMVLRQLHARTLERGEAPVEVADYAIEATRAALSHISGRGTARRIESYYNAVIRRRLVRRYPGSSQAARLVVGSVVADLLRSGRSAQDAWDELHRGWSHLLTPELSQEFQQRLSA